jgi:hypothetical protein
MSMEQDAEADELPDIRWTIARAYAQGGIDVHNNWEEDREPDFTEAGLDYADSLDLDALRTNSQDALIAELATALSDFLAGADAGHVSVEVDNAARATLAKVHPHVG